MRRSEAFLPTTREEHGSGKAIGLALRAGLVRRFGAGLYGFTPAGLRVRRKITRLIRAEMNAIGAQEVSLPQLGYEERWVQSGRWGSFEGEMFTLENREGRAMCLAPSHEEGLVHLVDGHVRSYEDLPLLLYQVGTKHRDDHPRNGLLRTKEFTMKDAYGLHADEASLDEWYGRVRAAYLRIFDGLGVAVAVCEADNSVMGGTGSEEFVAPVETGSCDLVHCTDEACRFGVTDEHALFRDLADGDDCLDCGGGLASGEGIEVGHVFKLGTRYSERMDLAVDRADGSSTNVVMGSYGIGVTRLLQTVIEQHADGDGCRWPETERGCVAPYRAAIIPLRYEGEIREAADRLHDAHDDVLLFDDDGQTIGERFAESDLLGIPQKVILGNHFRETGEAELETRDGETRYLAPDALDDVLGAR